MLITSATPLRISFVGGGSDYPEYFSNDKKGFVFGTTIDLYVYISILKHTNLSGSKYKISYRELDECNQISEIRHPVVRSVLEYLDWTGTGLHISTMSDVPAGTGLGSSSSFTVGLLNLIHTLKEEKIDLLSIAQEAVVIERKILAEPGGVQDQYHAAIGGLTAYEYQETSTNIFPIQERLLIETLSDSMILVPVGIPRHSKEQASKWKVQNKEQLLLISNLETIARETFHDFCNSDSPDVALQKLGNGIRESWAIKRRITQNGVLEESQPEFVIQKGLKAGAIAAKLCGAGGSGFVFFLVPIDIQKFFLDKLEEMGPMKVSITDRGTYLHKY
jgi:D-glycero-alpha-D-manno-heptose-7-phosphate kinase